MGGIMSKKCIFSYSCSLSDAVVGVSNGRFTSLLNCSFCFIAALLKKNNYLVMICFPLSEVWSFYGESGIQSCMLKNTIEITEVN